MLRFLCMVSLLGVFQWPATAQEELKSEPEQEQSAGQPGDWDDHPHWAQKVQETDLRSPLAKKIEESCGIKSREDWPGKDPHCLIGKILYRFVKPPANRIIAKIKGPGNDPRRLFNTILYLPDSEDFLSVDFGNKEPILIFSKDFFNKAKDADELSCLLGHEAGHVLYRHALKTVKRYVAWEKILKRPEGSFADFLQDVIESDRQQAQEYEADEFGANITATAGFEDWACADLWNDLHTADVEALRKYAPSLTRETIERIIDDVASETPSTHPSSKDRAENLFLKKISSDKPR